MLARVNGGKLPGGGVTLFGYRRRDADHTAYAIDEETAPIVRRLFALSATGTSLRAIAELLTLEGTPTPSGKREWSYVSVRYILRNTCYAGDVRANRMAENRVGGKTIRRWRGEDEQIRLPEGTAPPLVDEGTFALVQLRLQRNKAEARRNSRTPEAFLLRAGFVVCGGCGHAIPAYLHRDRRNGKENGRYNMKRHGDDAPSCQRHFTFSAAILDAAVWGKVEALLTDPKTVMDEVRRLRGDGPIVTGLAAVDRALVATAKQQGNLSLPGYGQAHHGRGRLAHAQPVVPQRPIAVPVEGVPMGVLAPPAEVVDDEFDVRQLGESAIERGVVAEQEGKLRARLAGQDREELARLAPE